MPADPRTDPAAAHHIQQAQEAARAAEEARRLADALRAQQAAAQGQGGESD